jgi:glycosyltransferase involved in cell wall biosynthesis
LHEKPVYTIPNGFDPDDVKSAPLTREFTITYTGLIYKGKQDPVLLLKALHELIEEGVIDPRVTKVRFFGILANWLGQEIKRYRLDGVVKQYGIVPRKIALKKQRESQILLLLNWNDPEERGMYTGKVFEYLAAKRPILAIGGAKGVISELLEETVVGVHTLNIASLKEVLSYWYREYDVLGQVEYHGKENKIQKYDHREMARKFVNVLSKILQA